MSNISDVVAWKFDGAPGIRTDGKKITGWPRALGRQPTDAEIATFTTEYALVVSDLRATQDLQGKQIRALVRWIAMLHAKTNPEAIKELRDIWKSL